VYFVFETVKYSSLVEIIVLEESLVTTYKTTRPHNQHEYNTLVLTFVFSEYFESLETERNIYELYIRMRNSQNSNRRRPYRVGAQRPRKANRAVVHRSQDAMSKAEAVPIHATEEIGGEEI
jgi:hypothetical protein